MFFFTSVFFPARMLGGILLNLIPVCPQLLLFVCGVMTVLLIYSLACTSAPYQCDGSFLVAFVQLCEEMLGREGMERKGKVRIFLGGGGATRVSVQGLKPAIMSGCGWW